MLEHVAPHLEEANRKSGQPMISPAGSHIFLLTCPRCSRIETASRCNPLAAVRPGAQLATATSAAAVAAHAVGIAATGIRPAAAFACFRLTFAFAAFATCTTVFHCSLLDWVSQHSQLFSKQSRRLHVLSFGVSLPQVLENWWSISTIRFRSAIFC